MLRVQDASRPRLGLKPQSGVKRVYRWDIGQARPNVTSLRRMTRLVLWRSEGRVVSQFAAIHWDEMQPEWSEDAEVDRRVNPFQISRHTWFAYGSTRDSVQVIRDLMDQQGLDRRAHLCRLLGLKGTAGYNTVRNWFQRIREPGPQYGLRILLLTLWGALGYRLSDIWAVDWEERTVAWWYGREPINVLVQPSNPFEVKADPVPSKRPARKARPVRDLAVSRMIGPDGDYINRELLTTRETPSVSSGHLEAMTDLITGG